MRRLKYLAAAAAIGSLITLAQTSSAGSLTEKGSTIPRALIVWLTRRVIALAKVTVTSAGTDIIPIGAIIVDTIVTITMTIRDTIPTSATIPMGTIPIPAHTTVGRLSAGRL